MDYKLQDTVSKDAFKYGYLLNKIYPYIKPVLGRALINLMIAIPLGLLDGVVALSLKPYLDFVVNGDPNHTWTFCGITVHSQAWLAAIIPFGIVAFALFQGVLKYLSNYLTDWTGLKISNSLKICLESAEIISVSSFFAASTARTVFPEAVGPTIAITFLLFACFIKQEYQNYGISGEIE